MAILEWLAYILREVFPPWDIVGPDEEGVRIRSVPLPQFLKKFIEINGGKTQVVRHLTPGFVFSVPFLDEVRKANVRYGKADLENIEVETADGVVYDISLVLEERVFNTVRALVEVELHYNGLIAAVQALVVRWANNKTGRLRVDDLLMECGPAIRDLGPDWGHKVRGIEVNSIAPPWERKEIEITHKLEG